MLTELIKKNFFKIYLDNQFVDMLHNFKLY